MEGVVVRGSWTVAAGASTCALVCATGSAAAAQPALNAKAAKQIAALQEIKRSLTPAERKLDSRLVVTLRRRADKAAMRALPRLKTGVDVSSSDRTEVDVKVAAVTAELLERLERVGARVRSVVEGRRRRCAPRFPMGALKSVARWDDVRDSRGRRRGDDASARWERRCARSPSRRTRGGSRQQLDEALESAPAPLQGDGALRGRQGPRRRHGARDDVASPAPA